MLYNSMRIFTSKCHTWESYPELIQYTLDLGANYQIYGHRNKIELNPHISLLFSILKNEEVDFSYNFSGILTLGETV